MEAKLWITSASALVLFVLLGIMVIAFPLSRLDVEAGALRGTATGAAIVFTESGRWLWLLLIAVAGIGAGLFFRLPLWLPAGILVWQSISQAVIEGAKHLFHRSRPDDWLFHHELGYSYPSGHASTAIVFFGGWLLVLLSAPLPRPVKLIAWVVLGVWMLGIDFSRLALSAHYLTDVIGGTLFGIFWLCAGWALALHFGLLSQASNA